MDATPEVVPFHEGQVRGFLHRAAEPSSDALVITHGAGGNSGMPLLVSVARAFAEKGVSVLRVDLPFRQKRPHGPPHPSAASADRAGLAEAVDAMRSIADRRIFLGGQSYGGRQASILASERPNLADALLLLSYPLHAPGKPGEWRTAHFPALHTPALFVHGTRDPFASSEELRSAISLIPARTAIIEAEGAGHDLARGKFDVAAFVVKPFLALAAR